MFISAFCQTEFAGTPEYNICAKSLFDLIVPVLQADNNLNLPISLLASTKDGPGSVASDIFSNYPYPTLQAGSVIVPATTLNSRGENSYSLPNPPSPTCLPAESQLSSGDMPVIHDNERPFEDLTPGVVPACEPTFLLNQNYIQLYLSLIHI